MILSYIKLAVRILLRNPFNSLINIVGLAIGFAAFYVLWQYSQAELHADQFSPGANRIFRVGLIQRYPENTGGVKEGRLGVADPELTRQIAMEVEGVEDYTRIFPQAVWSPGHVPAHGQEVYFAAEQSGNRRVFNEHRVVYADANVFGFFGLPLLQGDVKTVLAEPNSVAISNEVANRYFGKTDALGRTLRLNDLVELRVTGVFPPLPPNTHHNFDIAISSATLGNNISTIKLTLGGPRCYLRLKEGADPAVVERQVQAVAAAYYVPVFKAACNACEADAFIQPLADIAFTEGYWFDTFTPRSKYMLVVLSSISILILVMAWINYFNLATSASLKRIKELAARKTIGARYGDFVRQFFVESLTVNIVAVVLAVVILQSVRFEVADRLDFYLPDLSQVSISTVVIGSIAFAAGVVFTGVYPVFMALRRSPGALFSVSKQQRKGNLFSGALTACQLAFAVILIVWVFAVHLQLDFVLTKDLGFNRDQVIAVDLPPVKKENFNSQLASFLGGVQSVTGVENYAVSNSLPSVNAAFMVFEKDGKSYAPQTNGGVDERFLELYHIPLLAGRNFRADNPADQMSLIISRTTARRMGYEKPEDAVGSQVRVTTRNFGQQVALVEIIGVMEDYRVDPMFSSFNNKDGVALTYKGGIMESNLPPARVSLLVNGRNAPAVMEAVASHYASAFPGDVFSWSFLDMQIARFYEQERITRNQITFFTLLAILIASMGLLGVMRNQAADRVKEMGIRKVLGAEFYHLSAILLSGAARHTLIAVVAGIPLAIYLTQQYLEKFSDRVSLGWWHYAIPVIALALIMVGTVAGTLVKVARANPVDSLRAE